MLYGWTCSKLCPCDRIEDSEALEMLELAVDADLVPAVMLDPKSLRPTQDWLLAHMLRGLIDVEYTPAIFVIRFENELFIHDGHHRATRALLDGQMVRAAVFDFHDINAKTAKRYEV